ncbi:MAG: amidohydrolase family protein [Lachnospiraceae bacterium]|nr:amidohydrolase family protein [Lachnospiraceae bacterium]
MEILIKNGKVINASGTVNADILIRNDVIAEIGVGICGITADKVIDASGLYVLPGAIDAHTHLEMKMGKTFSADGYESGTRAAACGGVTTVFDYTLQENGKPMLAEIEDRNRLASLKACVDYAFHGGISEVNTERLNELEEMARQGFTSVKAYMTYDFGLGDRDLYRLLKASANAKILITVHAESDAIVSVNRASIQETGPKPVWYHYLSRPEIAEEEADIRAIKLAEAAGAPIYIVHLANAGGERYIAAYEEGLGNNALDCMRFGEGLSGRSAGNASGAVNEKVDSALQNKKAYCGKERAEVIKAVGNKANIYGKKIYAETCPHYLEFTNEVYKHPDGIRFICSPPMKGEESRKALWDGIRNGVIDTIATDHCPAQSFEKDWGKDDFTLAPNGCMGIENMYPYMLDAAGQGLISYEKAVELCSYNPSCIFGCDSKGEIAVGKDADIVLYDPKKQFTITKESMHSDLDYTIYEGKQLNGYPVMTISRGMIVYEDGIFKGETGYGKLLRRGVSAAYR